jgi:hypothetical protein
MANVFRASEKNSKRYNMPTQVAEGYPGGKTKHPLYMKFQSAQAAFGVSIALVVFRK